MESTMPVAPVINNKYKYDDIEAEKKRVYYINTIKPNKIASRNPKGRPKKGVEPVYKNPSDFEKAVTATKKRLESGSCLQPSTMRRYELDKKPYFVLLNQKNHLEYNKLPFKQLNKSKKLEIIVKSLLFHIMETKLDIKDDSFSQTIQHALELLKTKEADIS